MAQIAISITTGSLRKREEKPFHFVVVRGVKNWDLQ